MSWPDPQPGLVIRYSYLWERESASGREEGAKDRPCAVVITLRDEGGRTRVYALPITHTAPAKADDAIEIPAVVKTRLGLDSEQSWIVLNEANFFAWPGPDLRFLPGMGPETAAYGFLPPTFFRVVLERFMKAARSGTAALVRRSE